MTGGLIAGCKADNGSGVAVDGGFTMTGGTIKDCKTTGMPYDSYALCNLNGCIVNANGGDIYGVVCNSGTIGNTSTENNATTFHDAVYNVADIFSAGTVNGGIFKGDVVNTPLTRIDDSDVEIWPSISGGEFYGEVTVSYTFESTTYTMPSGNITGGAFYGGVDTDKISSDATWYEVKFDTNGGSRAPVTQVFVNVDDAKALKPTDPTRTGFTFVGWYEKDANGAFKDTAFDFANTQVTEDITLYAKWVCNHSGGTATCIEKAVCTVCGEEYGEKDSTNHAKTLGDWQSNGDGHWKTYICCPTVKALEGSHDYVWKSENGQYWQRCSDCGHETAKKDIPEITINGADKVCVTQDYTFTFTLPEGCISPSSAYYCGSNDNIMFDSITDFGNGVYSVTLEQKYIDEMFENGITTFVILAGGNSEDNYPFVANKTVEIQSNHTGGTADCTHKAKCKVCGEEYGEVDSGNHDLENIKGNAATVTEKGNTEYWHCKDCDGNFSDKDGKNAIDLKDTVIGKLPPEIIDGKGQSLTEGERRELIFRSNAAFGDFIRVELDGETVDGKNYTVKEGSTIVTLKADYVATLSAGEHTLGIVSESGTATTTFTVNAKAVDTNSPQTGDNSRMALWFALLFVSGGGLLGTTAYRRKKKYSVK